jgi:hypothetical protein
MSKQLTADLAGLSALAGVFCFVAFNLPGLNVSIGEWFLLYLFVAPCAIFVWHHPGAPKKPRTWLLVAVSSVVAALLWLGYARLGATLIFSSAEPNASRAFDFAIAGMISPGLTVIAAVGYFRAALLPKEPS